MAGMSRFAILLSGDLTVTNRLRQPLAADLKPRLLGGPELYRRRTEGAFEGVGEYVFRR